jgi:hypothetical protein
MEDSAQHQQGLTRMIPKVNNYNSDLVTKIFGEFMEEINIEFISKEPIYFIKRV